MKDGSVVQFVEGGRVSSCYKKINQMQESI